MHFRSLALRSALVFFAIPFLFSGAQAAGLPSGLGWHELPNTRLRPLCPSDAAYPLLHGGSGCDGVTAYSGGIFDPLANRLLIAGGGHNDWGGNEVYALDLNTATLSRLNVPSYPVRDGCVSGNNGTNADGKPVARHTYNHLAFLPEVGASGTLFLYGGSWWQCGGLGQDTWTFDLAGLTWTARPSAATPRGSFAVSVARDPVSHLLYARDEYNLWSYNPDVHAWSKRSDDNDLAVESYKGGIVQPNLRRYYFYVRGERILHSYSIVATTGLLTRQDAAAPTCAFMDNDAVGWSYDSALDRIVVWHGTDTITLLDAATATCTTQTVTGGPAALPWIYGRFSYSPMSNVHVSCNDIDDNCYILRLDDTVFKDGFDG
jgi:hypothetical protein